MLNVRNIFVNEISREIRNCLCDIRDFFFYLLNFFGGLGFVCALSPCAHKVSLKPQHSVTGVWSDKGSVQCNVARWSTVSSCFIHAMRGHLSTIICAEIAHCDHRRSSKNSPYSSLAPPQWQSTMAVYSPSESAVISYLSFLFMKFLISPCVWLMHISIGYKHTSEPSSDHSVWSQCMFILSIIEIIVI